MNKCFWRLICVTGAAAILAGCGNKETTEALQKATSLSDQKQYRDANAVLVDALRAREAKLRPDPQPTDAAAVTALAQKVAADSEILKMERAQIPIYLHMDHADLASAVYKDILTGHPGDTVIYDTLHDKEAQLRNGAVRVLGLVGKPEAIPALAGATKDDDKDVRRAAVAALGMIKDPGSIDPLIAALKDSYWFVRSEAAEALGQQHDPRAIKGLLDAVGDENSMVEGSAEAALLQICDGKKSGLSGDDFANRVNDSNPKIIMISAFCLAVLKDPRAVPVLMKLNDSTDQTTRLQAIKGLGETGDASVIPVLRKGLKDPDPDMRGWSIIGLDKLKDQGSLAALRAIAADDKERPRVKEAAAEAVQHITASTTAPGNP